MIKTIAIFFVIAMMNITLTSAQSEHDIEFGIKVMFGGRYDNMRMCVASAPNVKGGMIADIMFVSRFSFRDNVDLAFEIPVMRPILFAAAFKMLQFEPQMTIEFTQKIDENLAVIIGPSLGLSFHYGPDYTSDNTDNRGESFFAMGPIVSAMIGLSKPANKFKSKRIGIRAFYIPLFSKKSSLSSGSILGGVIEGQFKF